VRSDDGSFGDRHADPLSPCRSSGDGAPGSLLEPSFDDLLAAARTGDAAAWSALYHDVAPILIAYLRSQRLPDPENVAGEVLLEVVRGIRRFSGDRAHFRSWVLAIAHHRLLDARRREQRQPTTPVAPDSLDDRRAVDDPEAEALATVGFGALEPALRTLTADQRTVLMLRVIGDLPIAEVARITGKRAGAVKQLQHRAVLALRPLVAAEAPAGSRGVPRGPATACAGVAHVG
jgi:RNA polymerase sigma factor (sigma-70 family)